MAPKPLKVLLVNPWIHDFAAYDFWVRPLGLLTIAALLRRSGCSVRLVDCLAAEPGTAPKRTLAGCGKFQSEPIEKPEALRGVPRTWRRYGIRPSMLESLLSEIEPPDLMLVTSMMTYWYTGVNETIRRLRSKWPRVPLALGGVYASLCPEHARVHSGADVVVPGSGEETIPALVGDLLGRKIAFDIDRSRLDSYPFPALDLLGRADSAPLLTSRGCPFRCTYCASHRLSPAFRTRDPIRVVDEIEHWQRTQGIRQFAFYDDALLVDAPNRAVPMLEEILRRKLDCRFHCPNGLHLREITPRIASLLYRAGFQTIRFGYETSSRSRQIETGGKVDEHMLRDAIASLKGAGYRGTDIGVYLLCGLPRQALGEVEQGIDAVRSAGARPMIAEYSPIPGTGLWDEAVRGSRFDIASEPLFHNNTLLPCLTREVSRQEMDALKRRSRGGAGEQEKD